MKRNDLRRLSYLELPIFLATIPFSFMLFGNHPPTSGNSRISLVDNPAVWLLIVALLLIYILSKIMPYQRIVFVTESEDTSLPIVAQYGILLSLLILVKAYSANQEWYVYIFGVLAFWIVLHSFGTQRSVLSFQSARQVLIWIFGNFMLLLLSALVFYFCYKITIQPQSNDFNTSLAIILVIILFLFDTWLGNTLANPGNET